MKYKKYKGYRKRDRNPKYKNITFDSKTEIEYYKYLEKEKRAKRIMSFKYHPPSITYCDFKCSLTGRVIKHSYTTDFEIIDNKGNVIWVDTKGGFSPAEWKIRRDFILSYLNKNKKRLDFFKELCYHNNRWVDVNEIHKLKRENKKQKRDTIKKILGDIKLKAKVLKKKNDLNIDNYIKLYKPIKKIKLFYRGKLYRNKWKKVKGVLKDVDNYEKSKQEKTKDKYRKKIINETWWFSGLKYTKL